MTGHVQARDCSLYVRHEPSGNVARRAALIEGSDGDTDGHSDGNLVGDTDADPDARAPYGEDDRVEWLAERVPVPSYILCREATVPPDPIDATPSASCTGLDCAARATVSIRVQSVERGLDPGAVQRVVAGELRTLRRCYKRALMQRELNEGRVQVDVRIVENGVMDVVMVGGFDDAVATCAGHAIAQLRFPPSRVDGELRARIELAFRLPAVGVTRSVLDALTGTDDFVTCSDGTTIYGPLFGDVTDAAAPSDRTP